MTTQALRLPARVLPRGWTDLARQIVLFCGAYWLYRLVRGMVDGRAAAAFENARAIIDAERALGLFFEPAVHGWANAHAAVIELSSWTYLNSHFTITTITLAWIYLRRNERFYFVRNMFVVSMAIALVGYMAFPTAPPRFMPEWGFDDPVAAFTGVGPEDSASLLFNPFAAVPSMHVGFALMLGLVMARIVRRRWAAWCWTAYPALVTFVVVATANHWWLDAFLGALTAGAAGWAAVALGRMRPAAWAWESSRP